MRFRTYASGGTPDMALMTAEQAADEVGYLESGYFADDDELDDPTLLLVLIDYGNMEAWVMRANSEELRAMATRLEMLARRQAEQEKRIAEQAGR